MCNSSLTQSELPEEIVDNEHSDSEELGKPSRFYSPSGSLPADGFIIMWGFVLQISNAALNSLVLFLYHFHRVVASCSQNHAELQQISHQCPKSFLTAQSLLGLHSDDFVQYVVCRKCDSVYELEACIARSPNGELVSKRCIHIEFSNHSVHTS